MKKILAIDDNKDILLGISEICRLKNWTAYLAQGVNEALEVLSANDIDLILIDYHMPIISGLVGVEKIRKINPRVPIIVLTIDEQQSLADAFIDAGASDFALKPIKVPDLISRIRVHLKYSESTKEQTVKKREYVKGINESTLNIIENFIRSRSPGITLDEVSEGTGYAYQTVHRYLTYLIENGEMDMTYSSGKKGRPKAKYHFI